jgi:hypothetical protein
VTMCTIFKKRSKILLIGLGPDDVDEYLRDGRSDDEETNRYYCGKGCYAVICALGAD